MTNPPIKDNQTCLLKETRQQKGITLEMVHEATKVPLDALKSIEQGYSIHKLQSFYYRGFIKIYAKYLELDETQVLQEYGMLESVAPRTSPVSVKEVKSRSTPASSKVIAKEPSKPVISREMLNKRLAMLVRIAAAVLCVFFVLKWVVNFATKNRKNSQRAEVSKPVMPKPMVKPQSKSSAKNKIKEEVLKDTSKESDTATAALITSDQVPASDIKKENAKNNVSSNEKSDKKSKMIELTVRATKSGWLQVKLDGQIVFQSALKKGDSETWKAEKEIELSGRNINLLEFELNGKMLGALGASDRGAKKVVFTKDGLSVKK